MTLRDGGPRHGNPATCQPSNCPTADDALELRILATTDLHGHLRGHDYATGLPTPDTGLARIASLIAEARAEHPNTLLFDNGDFLQGTPLVDYWGQSRGLSETEIHPMIAAMNALGYDAGMIGNHEFNFGLDYLVRVLRDARHPLLLSNMTALEAGWRQAERRRWPQPQWPVLSWPVLPSTILKRSFRARDGQRHGLRIGIIGLLPPEATEGDRPRLAGRLGAHGMAEAAQLIVPQLRAAGADIVIALAHTGIEPLRPEGAVPSENLALALAAVEGIDALICGHSHMPFPTPNAPDSPDDLACGIDAGRGLLNGRPAVLPGRWGSHLGVIDLVLRRDGDGRWRPSESQAELRPVARRTGPQSLVSVVREHPRVVTLATPAHNEMIDRLSRVIGRTDRPLTSFFATVAPCAALDVVADVQAGFIRARLAGTAEGELPLLSAVAPSKAGGRGGPRHYVDIPAGPVTMRDVIDLYGYPNLASALCVTGEELADWLEHAAGAFLRIAPGATDATLMNPAFPCYNFDTISGLSYEIDLTQPARFTPGGCLADPGARRIRALCHAGQPVTPGQRFIVATNTYRSSGAGGFPRVAAPPILFGDEANLRDLVLQHAEAHGGFRPRARHNWRFTPLPGATVTFDTAPAASGRLHEAEGARLEEIGLTAQGFLKLRMAL
ncbi:bifunctional 2',3'-cyclic-nucleotide 2'-phosphodiesterase/3'-nucleotidase [Paenirhodobacter enshiensis]|uniref:bifunctional 2',3'-cyclic-nucleotide 2'-phosphodiesterase/3'-nucleotidase n=1 Tax=Paenirhodobacter enshiensis TaxID=1105367 RepID=UPI0035B1D61F